MIFVLALMSVMFLISLIISITDYRYSIKGVPNNVSHIYDEEKYNKWLAYYRDGKKFGLISNCFNFVVTFLLLILGVFGMFESLSEQITDSVYLQVLLFMGMYFIISFVLELPFDYYDTFVLEQKHGFNKSTKKTFWADKLKGFLMTIVLGGSLIFGLNAVYTAFIDQVWLFILIAWAGLSVIMIVIFMLNTKVFVKIFNKLTPLEEGSLKTKIDALAGGLGFEIDKISIMDASKRSTKLNAFFSGLGKHRDVVLYDTLVEKMEEEQILAVLGHELSHALNKDTTKMLAEQILMFGVYAAFIGLILNWTYLYTGFGLSGIHFGFAVVLFAILIEPIGMLLQIPLNYISRVAEYRADKFGAEHVSKEAMITALEVLARENFSNLNPHPLSVVLNYNHPTISQRIKAINEL